MTPTATPIPALTWKQLKSATYVIPPEMGGPDDGQIPLQDGVYGYTPVPGSASVERYLIYPGVAFGDIDGDANEDAVVILINVSSGSGNFYHLIPVRNAGGQPQPLNATFIGDRVVVEQVLVVDGEEHLLFRTYRPEEPYGSTPTLHVARRYVLKEDTLQQINEEVLNADEAVNEAATISAVAIQLPPGGGSASYTGKTGAFGLDKYALPLAAGQAVTITVTSPHQDAFLSIFGLDLGGPLLRTQEEQARWLGTISDAQRYAINVFAIGTETDYRLTIEAGAPAATPIPSPAATATPAGEAVRDRVMYLTFDDGPTPPYTREILELLARYGARATFFVLGTNGAKHPDLLEMARQAGHSLANHTWSHRSLVGVSQDDFDRELLKTAQALGEDAVPCLRPPYGATDSFTRAYAAELGYDVVMWNVDTLDWTRPGAEAIALTVLDKVGSGAIVLMHDGGGDRSETVAALEAILRNLSDQGFVLEPLCQ
jgi:peptidoglycan/xylan/chitin deacetylase (PgdA/CDA1 family)